MNLRQYFFPIERALTGPPITPAEKVLGMDDPVQVRRLARRMVEGRGFHTGTVTPLVYDHLLSLPRVELRRLSQAHLVTVEEAVIQMKASKVSEAVVPEPCSDTGEVFVDSPRMR